MIFNNIALDKINNKPIYFWINSPGGLCSCGFAIIDTMKRLRSPVFTIVSGSAYSMAGFISVAGDKRLITKNSDWMGHDVFGGSIDYGEKVIDTAEHLKKLRKRLNEFYEEHTDMTKADIRKATHGELWLNPYECLKKGIVDGVIANPMRRRKSGQRKPVRRKSKKNTR